MNHATRLSHTARSQLSDVVVFAGTAPSSAHHVDTMYVYIDTCVCICHTAGVNMTHTCVRCTGTLHNHRDSNGRGDSVVVTRPVSWVGVCTRTSNMTRFELVDPRWYVLSSEGLFCLHQ